jgi:hypothetical protein
LPDILNLENTGRKYLDTGRPGEKGQNRESPGGTGRVDRSVNVNIYTNLGNIENEYLDKNISAYLHYTRL